MNLNSQTRIILATAAALAVVDIAVRVIPFNHNSAATGNVVTASEFRLVDQWGNERATLAMDGNGEPGFKLFDRNGTMRAQLDTFENTPSLILCDKEGARRTYFGMDNDTGSGILDMYDQSGASLANMSLDGNTGHITVGDSNGNSQSVVDTSLFAAH